MTVKKVLITGVYGLIASAVFKHLQAQPDAYEVYGLARRRHPSVRVADDWSIDIPEGRFIQSDLSDLDEVVAAVKGMDAIVHMAAEPHPAAPWDKLLASNIVGAYNVLEASRIAGVKRVIYASSIMVSFGYLESEPYKAIVEGRLADVPNPIPVVTAEDPTRPRDLYASTKILGEAMAQTYAYRHGVSTICLRIGSVNADDRPHGYGIGMGATWCSLRDIVQLVERSVNAPEDLRFDIYYGMSDNRWCWVDIQHARDVLGYAPQDHAEDYVITEMPDEEQALPRR